MHNSPIILSQKEEVLTLPPSDRTTQPSIFEQNERKFVMEDDYDVEDEKKLLKDELRRLQKVDSVATIASLRMKPEKHSRLCILLCRLVAMLIVRTTLSSDIQKLEQEFAHGYCDGATVFYVSTTKEARESSQFTDHEVNGWDD